MIETSIYPVGILRDLLFALHIARKGRKGTRARNVRLRLRLIPSDIKRRLGAGDRRALRNYFNGYLAEHGTCPHNAGRGWTKRAAERRVYRICDRYWSEQ